MVGTFDRSYHFDAGIRFECTKCGHCCTGSPGHVRVTPDETLAISEFTRQPIDHFLMSGESLLREKENGDCIFYDNGCTIYPARPSQCRTYPFWFKNLRSEDAWAKTCAECPGIGQGRLYSKEEILNLLNETG